MRNEESNILLLDTTRAPQCGQSVWWYFQLYFAVTDEERDQLKQNCTQIMGNAPLLIDPNIIETARKEWMMYRKCGEVLK